MSTNVKMTTFSAGDDENFVKMTTFSHQCMAIREVPTLCQVVVTCVQECDREVQCGPGMHCYALSLASCVIIQIGAVGNLVALGSRPIWGGNSFASFSYLMGSRGQFSVSTHPCETSWTLRWPHHTTSIVHVCRVDSWPAPSQWETSLQSNAVSHWLGANRRLHPANERRRCKVTPSLTGWVQI